MYVDISYVIETACFHVMSLFVTSRIEKVAGVFWG